MHTIQAIFSDAVVTLAAALIGLLAAYALKGIKKATDKIELQTKKLKNEDARQTLNNALWDVERIATITVAAIEQTTAKALRAAVKDGRADRDDLVALSKQALDEITAAIKPEAQKIITENIGKFEG